ncbi:MAG TPA: hypothetical protein VGH73_00245 [Thermoanaerobaculia bacterium]|jgi:hypothetical protein
MAWTLQLADDEGDILNESFVVLDDEVVAYLAGFTEFPVLRNLKTLDPREETWIDAEVREMLEREVAELAARVRRRAAPAPPDWVGLEGTGDLRIGEEFGWRGLLDFLQRFEHLLHLARRMRMELWGLPND